MIHTDNTDESNTLGNIYQMTLAASQRVYELRRGSLPKVEPEHSNHTTALKEIQDGKVTLEILEKLNKRKSK